LEGKNGRAKLAMSYDQASAIVIEGLRRGTRRHRSIALGVAAQFEFTLREIDVIAEWERVDLVKELPSDAIISHRQVWRPGLRFEDFAGGEVGLETSKTQTKANSTSPYVRCFSRLSQLRETVTGTVLW
jgi:hypothetical protein